MDKQESNVMKAVVATDYGPPEQYTVADVPVPRPGPGQLRVRIAAASVNPADVKLPGGEFRGVVEAQFPYIPGVDFAGTVTEIGEGVQTYAVGDEVFGTAVPRVLRAMAGTRPSLGTGAMAEYAVVEADTPLIAHRPAALAAPDAAALATAGQAALATARAANVQPGERVLLVGATGGVGTALLPLLAAAKAHVIATATDADGDAETVQALGANEIIGYQESDYPADVDVAINVVLPGDRLAAVAKALRPGGRVLTITFPITTPDMLGRDDVELRFILDMDAELASMHDVAEAGARGELRATIARRYSLDEGPQACADFVRRHTLGKRVVVI
ncbi:NADPH:quinone reductase-like Zn-dependent oxidoreductase [Catenulispora sp. EB89]|uniref:NADP-dependent oxidoreductase n=1 Tax=Catenulispora sp. EB89 TaxID=3156257 RepID=UPI0035118165